MGSAAWWFVAGFVLLIAEMVVGTFYLLVVAVALAAAGLASLFGLPIAAQLTIAAALAFGGSLWLRRTRKPGLSHASEDLQHMDFGQTVHVTDWSAERTTRVNYRGALWDADLAAGEPSRPGVYAIREIRSNRLVLAAVPPASD